MKLSVLDQSTASKGVGQDTAIRESLTLARHCEALGYHRYWVSEHHNSDSIVGTAPSVVVRTNRLIVRCSAQRATIASARISSTRSGLSRIQ